MDIIVENLPARELWFPPTGPSWRSTRLHSADPVACISFVAAVRQSAHAGWRRSVEAEGSRDTVNEPLLVWPSDGGRSAHSARQTSLGILLTAGATYSGESRLVLDS
ncbi:hypothetical protein PCH_Pc23g00410 [Penicillium rubens Wisconsin 54-1255]|uniref:Uncharacterized protein n=2 Tax=Penicillium TaxID=5073 RepID=B6HW95_PENRW|nr:hypothetical protein PCH_Pc23g00410 [Penicillium rubens Wisconsin 54-1255]CRL31505.1 unnamed protein product [Penicillium camemberti]